MVGNEKSIVKALVGPISLATIIVSFGPYLSPYYFIYLIVTLIAIIWTLQRIDANRKQTLIKKYTTIRSLSSNSGSKGSVINLKNKKVAILNGIDEVDIKRNSINQKKKTLSKKSILARDNNNRHSFGGGTTTTTQEKLFSKISSLKTKLPSPKNNDKYRIKTLRRKFSKSYHYSIEDKLQKNASKCNSRQFYDPENEVVVTVK